MRYAALGRLPRKRHSQFRENGRLLVEEVMGYEGFSGNESILYHLGSPCRIADAGVLRPLEREEWEPDAHVHRLTDTNDVAPGGDPVSGRRVLMFNNDVEVSVCKPTDPLDGFYRNGEGDEVIYVHRGGGVLRTVFGQLSFGEKDYVVLPRGTTCTWELEDTTEQYWLVFHTPGELETPSRYRNRYGQLLEHAPFSQRDFRPPGELETFDEAGEWRLTVRVRGGLQPYVLDRHPFDVVGWDGYVWPYAFNALDFEPRAGRFHLPPPAHQTFQGPGFVICTFAPRLLDWDPDAVPLPYHHSNIQSEEVMFYADGDYAARKGVQIGCVTLHPSGLPHGPQPGAVEKSLGATRTTELAVMWDTFRPLRLTTLWRAHDKPEYAYSWNPDRDQPPTDGVADRDGAVTVTGPSAGGSVRGGSVPRVTSRIRLPAEWEPHERTIMGWPCRQELWGETLEQARGDYAIVANAIAAFEPVTMIANAGEQAAQARAACSEGVDVVELALDDSWLRDCGPIYGYGADGQRTAVHFRFNAWGGKFPPWDRDAAVGRLIAERLGDRVVEAPLVLEGGAIVSDGAGTLLTTEQCLLNPNRNPDLSREQIEEALKHYLGVQRIVWLGQGLIEDRDTDGHVDLIAAFTEPDRVLLQTVPDGNPNYGNCEENRHRLEAAGIDVVEMPFLPYIEVAGEPVAAGHMNLYIGNGVVIVPVAGCEDDDDALAIIAGAFPGRDVVPVPGAVIAYGGGGPHCITQQVPVRNSSSS